MMIHMNDEPTLGVSSPKDRSTLLDLIERLEMPSDNFAPRIPAHRAQYSDLEWARQQSNNDPIYFIGDLVEAHEGGYGSIVEVSRPSNGWPSSYALEEIEGLTRPPRYAWYYEGDFKRLVAPSPLRSLDKASL